MSNKFYKGTADQALAFAEDEMRRWAETKSEAENFDGIKDAMQNLLELVYSLENTLDRADRNDLLNAVFMFHGLEQALDIVRIKVNEARDNDEDDENEFA